MPAYIVRAPDAACRLERHPHRAQPNRTGLPSARGFRVAPTRRSLYLLAAAATLAAPAATVAQVPDQPFLRMQYLREERAYPFGRIPVGALQRAWSDFATRWPSVVLNRRGVNAPLDAAAAVAANGRSWAPLGPAPIQTAATGRLATIAVHPDDPATIYIGGAQGGVWKTTNGGVSWAPLTDGECSLAMGSIAIDPVNPQIVYAGTGELHFSGDSYYGCGVLRSTDAGATWTQLGAAIFDSNTGGARISKIIIDPASAGTASATAVYASTSVGVYRSTDSGLNWTRVLEGIATDMVMDPSAPATLYAAIGSPSGNALNGVYKSTNGGLDWNQLGNGLPTSDVGRIALAIAPSDPGRLYAAVQISFNAENDGGRLLGIYHTNDGGASWIRAAATDASCGSQCWYDLVIAVDPIDAGTVWFGGVFLYRSTDGAASFRNVLNGIHVDQHALTFDPRNPGTLYAGNDGGIYRTTTAGASWQSLNTNLALTQFYSGISPHPIDPAAALGGTQDNGTLEYSGVPTWQNVVGGDGGFTAIDFRNPGIAYAETQWTQNSSFGGPRRRDLPGSFVRMANGIDPADRALFIPPIVMDPTNPSVLYFGTFRVYRTNNRAGAWGAISPDLSKGTGRVSAIAPAPADSATIYVGMSDGNLQVTRNLGGLWNLRTTGLPNRHIKDIVVDRAEPGTAILSVSGFNTGHVFRTTDFGVSWTDISGNLPDVPVNAVLEIADEIFIGTDLGVFVSSDLGASWTPFMAGLPNVAVFDLAYSNETGVALAGTHGRGMFAFRPLSAAAITVTAESLRFDALLDTLRLGATVLDSLGVPVAKPFISWRSMDPSVASVDGAGLVRSRANGSTGIVATMAGVSDTTLVAVDQVAVTLTGLPDTVSLVVGEIRSLEAVATDLNGQPLPAGTYNWSSTNPAAATVDGSGRVAAVAPGNTTVLAQFGALADSTGIRVGLPSTATLTAFAVGAVSNPSSAAGTRLPLLRLDLSVDGFEPVEITRLGFEVTGNDPDASILVIHDSNGNGQLDPTDRQLSRFSVNLQPGAPTRVTLSTSGFAVPGERSETLIVALQLSGRSPNGARFQARFLPGETATIGQQSRLENRLQQPAQPVESALIATSLLGAEALVSFSENPVRNASLIVNFAEAPRTAAIYTLTGRLVLEIASRVTEDGRFEWDLRNTDGTLVAPGVYLVIFDVQGVRHQEKIIILRRHPDANLPTVG